MSRNTLVVTLPVVTVVLLPPLTALALLFPLALDPCELLPEYAPSPSTAAVLFLSLWIISTSSCTGRHDNFTRDEDDEDDDAGVTNAVDKVGLLEDPLEVAGEGSLGHALERKTNAGELRTEREVAAVKGVPGE